MLALTDNQLEIVINALRQLPTEEQRAIFLKLMADQLAPRSVDVKDATERALHALTDGANS